MKALGWTLLIGSIIVPSTIIGLLVVSNAGLGFALSATCFAVMLVLTILVFRSIRLREQREQKEATAKCAAAQALASEAPTLERIRADLVHGCPKCDGDLGIEPDTPIEKVQQVISGRCFYCGTDLRTAIQTKEN